METSPIPQEPEQQLETDTVIVDWEGLLQPGDTSTVFHPDGNVVIYDDDE